MRPGKPGQLRPGADGVAWHLSPLRPFRGFSTAGLPQGRQTSCRKIRAAKTHPRGAGVGQKPYCP